MAWRSLLCVVLFMAAGLAGCTDAPEARDPADEIGRVTDPKDFSYLENESAPGSHIHDYWNGQDVLTVLVDNRSTGASHSSASADGVRMGHFRPPTDSIIPQGSAFVHVTVDWDIAASNAREIALYVKTANESTPRRVAALEQDVPVTLNSTNADNDPPHHRLSLWVFEVRALAAEGQQTEVSDFDVVIEVKAERGLPIPVYPPHPDLWQGRTELTLHEGTYEVPYQIESARYWTCTGDCLGRHAPDDGMVVPYDAARVVVRLEVDEGFPATLGISYHGADTWTWSRPDPDVDEPMHRTWELSVEGRPDSPYAKQSLWDFYVENAQPQEQPKVWSGTYSIRITVER